MKQHEREYFISRIRSGVYYIKSKEKNICIKSPTLEDEFFINEKFKEEYDKCLEEGLKTEDEIFQNNQLIGKILIDSEYPFGLIKFENVLNFLETCESTSAKIKFIKPVWIN